MSVAPDRIAALEAALASDADWQSLLRHFDFNEGFAFGLLLVESREIAALCRNALVRHLAATGGEIESYFPASPEEFEVLLHGIPSLTVEPRIQAVWIDAVITPSDEGLTDWRTAWRHGFAGLNQVRNRLQANWHCTLIFAGAEWTKAVTREAAPDLWSIRALVTAVSPRLETDGTQSSTTQPSLADIEERTEYTPDPEYALERAAALRGQAGSELTLIDLLNRAGDGFLARNAFDKAVKSFLEAHQLAEQFDDQRQRLAKSANGLGKGYNRTGNFQGAEAAYRESLSISRGLAEGDVEAFLPDVARTLNNMAILYSDTQRTREAEIAFEEALSIRRRLAKVDPDTYLPNVATTLNNMAVLYSDTQRIREAETAYAEALRIHRGLAEVSPGTYLPGVAMTLNNMAVLYSDTQRMSEAESAYAEALKIRRALADADPDTYLPSVAMTLNNMAVLYNDTQRISEAESAYAEALKIRRALADAYPDAYLPDLAMTLNNMAVFYNDTQRGDEAAALCREAELVLRPLWQLSPEVHGNQMARTLWTLADLLGAEDMFEGCRLAREAQDMAYDPQVKAAIEASIARWCGSGDSTTEADPSLRSG